MRAGKYYKTQKVLLINYVVMSVFRKQRIFPGVEYEPLSQERTDKERLLACDNFIADAGSYTCTDSNLTVQNYIAKIPKLMTPLMVLILD